MNNSRAQWSIGQMLLWVLVIALCLSHLPKFFPAPMEDFRIPRSDISSWISELDKNATTSSTRDRTNQSKDTYEIESNLEIITSNISKKEMLAHIKSNCRGLLSTQGWTVVSTANGIDHFAYHATQVTNDSMSIVG